MEFQDELELNMTAMDFRQYDNALGRFHGVDLLAEVDYSGSPYSFSFNNPVYFSDPSGLFPTRAAAMAHINQYGLSNATVTFGDVGWIVNNGGYNFYQSSSGTMWMSFVSNDGVVNVHNLGGGGGGGSSSSGGFGSSNAGGFASSNYGGFGSSNGGGFSSGGGSSAGSGFIGLGISALGNVGNAVSGYAMYKVASGFKSANNLWDFQKLPKKNQNWRIRAELGPEGNAVLGKYGLKILKYSKVIGVVGTVAGLVYSGHKIYNGTATTIDYVDVGVGAASIGAVVFLVSNPIGWAIGASAGVYFAGRFIYDLTQETND